MLEMDDSNNRNVIQWQRRIEQYFAETGEKAHCLSWIHRKAEAMYSARNVWIDLPVIILGTLNGAVSVGTKSLFGENPYAPIIVGVVSLLSAIMTTIGSYFAWNRRAEGHRISSLSYAKLYRFLAVEMSLPRCERMMPSDLLKYVKTEYDRLSEISPLIPPRIIKDFKDRFSDAKYAEISKPEDANGLHSIQIFSREDMETPHLAEIVKTPVLVSENTVIVPNELYLGDIH